MITVIGVGGVPGSGKSTLFRAFLDHFAGEGSWSESALGLVKWSRHPARRLVVLGDYSSDSTFPGTDRLSMAVRPQAMELLRRWASDRSQDGLTVLFEGDRLFARGFMGDVVSEPEVRSRWLILRCSQDELDRRYRERGSDQDASWLKGMTTKLENLRWKFMDRVEVRPHQTPADTQVCLRLLLEWSGVPVPPAPGVAAAASAAVQSAQGSSTAPEAS